MLAQRAQLRVIFYAGPGEINSRIRQLPDRYRTKPAPHLSRLTSHQLLRSRQPALGSFARVSASLLPSVRLLAWLSQLDIRKNRFPRSG